MTRPAGSNQTTRRRSLAEWFASSRLGARAKDDRGHSVLLLDQTQIRASSTLADPVAAARLAWAREELKAGNFGHRFLLITLFSWVLLPVLDGSNAPAAVWLIVIPLWAALLWQLNRLIARRGNARRTHRVASLLASHGLCPTCAYSLADLAPEPDGCTVCPECGGAWKRRVITSAGPALPGLPRTGKAGWRRHIPCALVGDDRREKHPTVRLSPDSLLKLPWSDVQRQRLTAALHDARDASRTDRRAAAAVNIGFAMIFLVLFLWITRLAIKMLSTDFSPIGGWEIVGAMVMAGFVAFQLGMAGIYIAQARRDLSPRAWLDFPKGYACLPRHGFCAACFNDLSVLDAEPDGCTVCPECGAAWKLSEQPGSQSPARDGTRKGGG